ncbi:MAG TPA: patatin-like protein [Xanthobacteraceae bacterium]|nr:patatin-like protein [Xanthobacteraceae bacterium]
MREKELRIALVCFGGISLAIYMHGVTKEILKLVRASSALHAIADRSRRAKASFFNDSDRTDPEYDTEGIYFELLREIGRNVEMRVVVDIIAGASAGGINGTMLARALSHDLPMNALRDLWLDNADVTILLAPDARAGTWSKWFLKPFLWAMTRTGSFRAVTDMEVRQKLSLFVRSRWFKPPLDGRVMARLMYDAVVSMGAAKSPRASLLPSGQSLDLFVTLTDYYGYQQLVQIHDPPLIYERDHHHVLHFTYRRHSNGEVESDFGLDNAPGLAFAARATSSFPGAFPPARIVEMNEVVLQRNGSWPRRAEFIAKSFPNHLRAGIDPTTVSFLDGSVLNNRPFQEAISAIHGRPAFREIDRRLVYVDPHPAPALLPRQQVVPGFFAMLRGALSDIPSSQPVIDELTRVIEFNEQVRRLRAIVDSARPHISQLVGKVVTATFNRPISSEELRAWREQVNSHVARDAGFAYQAYVRLKLASVRAFGAELIVKLRGVPAQSPLSRVVSEIIDAWALHKGIVYERADSEALEFENQTAEHLPAWVKYLLAFDVKYRVRRMHFLIAGQNRLYQLIDEDRFAGLDPLVVDQLKREFYGRLDALRRREDAGFYSREVRELAADIFPAAPSGAEVRHLEAYAASFVEQYVAKLDRLIEQLAAEIDLNASTREIDDLLASLDPAEWHPEARREVLVNYLGFPFWDVLTFPMTRAREIGELNEILIDRISPQDARTLSGFDGIESLKGIGFGHFAGFLSRAYRENDYLLGRLHALDRLINIVCDAAGVDPKADGIDVLALKKRGFAAIIAAEETHLTHSRDLIAALRRSIGEIGA